MPTWADMTRSAWAKEQDILVAHLAKTKKTKEAHNKKLRKDIISNFKETIKQVLGTFEAIGVFAPIMDAASGIVEIFSGRMQERLMPSMMGIVDALLGEEMMGALDLVATGFSTILDPLMTALGTAIAAAPIGTALGVSIGGLIGSFAGQPAMGAIIGGAVGLAIETAPIGSAVGTIIGGAIGGIFGGPAGALIAAPIGAAIGSLIENVLKIDLPSRKKIILPKVTAEQKAAGALAIGLRDRMSPAGIAAIAAAKAAAAVAANIQKTTIDAGAAAVAAGVSAGLIGMTAARTAQAGDAAFVVKDDLALAIDKFNSKITGMGFATGTPYVPETGIYRLERGEKVISASQNVGGGGGDVHIVIEGNVIGQHAIQNIIDEIELRRSIGRF